MNGLFRFACIALSWGLFVTIGLAAIVMGKGIPPEALKTFSEKALQDNPKRQLEPQQIDRQQLDPSGNALPDQRESSPPEFFARAETASRLDVAEDTEFNMRQRSLSSLSVARTPETSTDENQPVLAPSDTDFPLPPDPDEFSSPDRVVEPMPSPAEPRVPTGPMITEPQVNESQATTNKLLIEEAGGPKLGDPTIQVAPPPPANYQAPPNHQPNHQEGAESGRELPHTSKSAVSPGQSPLLKSRREQRETLESEISIQNGGPYQVPAVEPLHPSNRRGSATTTNISMIDSTFVDRLVQMQRQLDQIAATQHQDRQAARSQFEMTQMFQQRKLEEKLEGIEQGLRDLQAVRTAPAPPPHTVDREGPEDLGSGQASSTAPIQVTAPLIREEKRGVDGQQRFSVNSQGGDLRELLDALAQKANFNLVLAINVEGDVELSLQNATAEEALAAIKKTTGYVVEKSGQRVYVGPAASKTFQRQEFLPPIIK